MQEDVYNPIIDKKFIAYCFKKSISWASKRMSEIQQKIKDEGKYEVMWGQITLLDLIDYFPRLNYKTAITKYKEYEKRH